MGISAVHMALRARTARRSRRSSASRICNIRRRWSPISAERNIAIFSTDIDSFDFKIQKPEQVIKSVMTKLEKRGKGIILMHDFQRGTAEALPELLRQLKAGGYKVVHMVRAAAGDDAAQIRRNGHAEGQAVVEQHAA